MFWILNNDSSQAWGGELTSITCVTKETMNYEKLNKVFTEVNGFSASEGYIGFRYYGNGSEGCALLGFNSPVKDIYNNILDQIVKQQGAKVIDIRQFDYAGMV